jgi:hypothetical protein
MEYTVPIAGYNINASCRVSEPQHLVGLSPDVVPVQQPLQLLSAQCHYWLLEQPRPMKLLPAFDDLVPERKAVAVPV